MSARRYAVRARAPGRPLTTLRVAVARGGVRRRLIDQVLAHLAQQRRAVVVLVLSGGVR